MEMFNKKSTNHKYLYLHIPKTAGTAIIKQIKKSKFKDNFTCKSHEYTTHKLNKSEKSNYIFTSIRNPISWYASLYNFKMNPHPPDATKDYFWMPNNSLEDFIEDIVLVKNGKEGLKKWHKPWESKLHIKEMVEAYLNTRANEQIGFLTLNFLYYCFDTWNEILKQKDINQFLIENYQSLISVNKVIRMENLQQEFNEMLEGTKIEVDLSKKINATSSNPYLDQLSQKSLDSIKNRDRAIFEIFGYL